MKTNLLSLGDMKQPAMNRCKTCKHWDNKIDISNVPYCHIEAIKAEWPRLENSVGKCRKFVFYGDDKQIERDRFEKILKPLDVVFTQESRHENQWGSGGAYQSMTGQDFGCIHHEPLTAE
jgi:hypothetical protein